MVLGFVKALNNIFTPERRGESGVAVMMLTG